MSHLRLQGSSSQRFFLNCLTVEDTDTMVLFELGEPLAQWHSITLVFVDHSTIRTEKSSKMQQYIKIYYSIFVWSSTCFGQHTTHDQEPKTALATSGLHTWKVVGRVVAGRCQAEYSACKPEAANAVLGSWWWAVCCPKLVELRIHMK